MKHIFTLTALVFAAAIFGQGDCPELWTACGEGTFWDADLQRCVAAYTESTCLGDLDGDGLPATSDLLLFLSVFGEPCSNPDPGSADEPLAILFVESSADSQLNGTADEDLLTYMLEGAPFQEWFGWNASGPPDLANSDVAEDFKYWMNWPGFVNGTLNTPPAQLVAIPQEGASGEDAFGNLIEEFKFVTTQFELLSPAGSSLQFVAITPRTMNNGDLLRYSTVGYDWVGSPVGATYQTTTTSGISSVDLGYDGEIWPNTTYRVHTNSGSLNHSVGAGSGPIYFRGGVFVLE